jgi:hypothetical protein
MYSGSTLTPLSGRLLGAHQKIDRVARRTLRELMHESKARPHFPRIRLILRFEGNNGPDAIKRKSPAQDEPWHFFDPFNEHDTKLIAIIQDHYDHLVQALKRKDDVRASFEAAWLAHAIVDGLTPAHHYPYEEKLAELRGGESRASRDSVRKKLVMSGDTRREVVRNNWKMWGPKGLLITHSLFEMGVALAIAPLKVSEVKPSDEMLEQMLGMDFGLWFQQKAREVAALDMYEAYYRHGWTTKLARQVRRRLGPMIVQAVVLAWYSAAKQAGRTELA